MIQLYTIPADTSASAACSSDHREEHMENPRKTTFLGIGLQCTTAASAIVTTRHVMSKGLHYPYHLLLVHALAVLLLQAANMLFRTLGRDQRTTQDRSERCSGHTGLPRVLVVLLPCIHMACVVGTLLCVYQATFHFIALPVLAMLLILDWSSILANTERLPLRGLLLSGISMCGMAMLFAFDRKLTKGGIIGSVVAIVLTGLARSIDTWTTYCCDTRQAYPCRRWQGSLAVPLLVILISPAMIRRYEYPIYTPAGPVSLGGPLALNIICVVAAWWCNRSYLTQPEAFSDDVVNSEYISGNELRHLILPIAFVGLVTAGSSFDYPAYMVSAWQHFGFLIAMSAIYIASHSTGSPAVTGIEKDYELVAGAESEVSSASPVSMSLPKRISFALILTLFAGVLCFLVPTYWSEPHSVPHRAILRSTVPALPRKDETNSLDVVVSIYKESAISLADNLEPLLELEAMRNRATRIVVYSTGDNDRNSTFETDLQHALRSQPQITVEHRANVGREGAAFLHHITSQWNYLADHTLFMQAELHQPGHVRRLLQNYLVARTGFLSLSSLQDSCSSCNGCWDHSTWSESQTVLEDIYSRANSGAKCKGFVLTYRGQFVASRNRIRSPGKQLFDDLLDGMTNPKSDKHSEEYISQPWLPQKIDSLNDPLFGFTIERIWGVLMGCSDRRLALTCPSRLSGLMKLGSPNLSDCQCLDEIS